MDLQPLSQFPSSAVFRSQVIHCLLAILRFEPRGIPLQFVAGAEGDVPQKNRFGKSGSVSKIAGGRTSCFAGFNPFVVVADRGGNVWGERLEIGELRLWQKFSSAIISQKHSFFANK